MSTFEKWWTTKGTHIAESESPKELSRAAYYAALDDFKKHWQTQQDISKFDSSQAMAEMREKAKEGSLTSYILDIVDKKGNDKEK